MNVVKLKREVFTLPFSPLPVNILIVVVPRAGLEPA